ncbi:NYN domain-containing protein [Gordonia pseudamarae]|uniref:NYN domain-containing protein n=1 Tax=Gordonia pseudamarae TaxID=2831662 RepID=A0ABX6IMF5_9ACTN|nr:MULTISPECIES: NYN domain-containing protein [Gordonia]MBD0021239.1 NYN domain-containing protein [Gordonia sp. (in: high G+C Gram-positive bacteria)]QHN27603.1 NYN domain-containing protein [Gordonia pseudamarae]QHN36485.1 NYN domain-containing protein [Gordonia pseudamarae]
MRSTNCVYVDVGYLIASAATRATGTSLRSGINVDEAALISALISTAADLSGRPTLRVHWYDSAKDGVPDARQERIGELPKVKLRLGRFGVGGEQKGVDLRIGLDLVTHARNNASDVFFLVSGDDDLTEAVEEAQVHGVQVVVLAVPNAAGKPHGISRHLLRAVDDMRVIDGAAVDAAVIKIDRKVPESTEPQPAARPSEGARPGPKPGPRPAAPYPAAPKPTPTEPRKASPATIAASAQIPIVKPGPVAKPEPTSTLAYSSNTGEISKFLMPGYDTDIDVDNDDTIEAVAERVLSSFLDTASVEDVRSLATSRPSIPQDLDRAMLMDASDALAVGDIPEPVRHRLREMFWQKFNARRP